jgi:putative transposase
VRTSYSSRPTSPLANSNACPTCQRVPATCTTCSSVELASLKYFVPRLTTIWADAAYRGKELVDWCTAEGDWDLEVVARMPGVRGFAVVPKRRIVERTFGWLSRYRRMSKDDERKVQTSETLIEGAMIRLLISRLGKQV